MSDISGPIATVTTRFAETMTTPELILSCMFVGLAFFSWKQWQRNNTLVDMLIEINKTTAVTLDGLSTLIKGGRLNG